MAQFCSAPVVRFAAALDSDLPVSERGTGGDGDGGVSLPIILAAIAGVVVLVMIVLVALLVVMRRRTA